MNVLPIAAGVFSHAALAFVALFTTFQLALVATPMPEMKRAQMSAQLVRSASGEILWGFLAEDGSWRFRTRRADVDPSYLAALIAYEDRRFRAHAGVDVIALGRSLVEGMRRGRVVSGGSTLTMQVVRLLEPRPRSVSAKIEQIFKAIKLERTHSKDDILDLYLTLAPFGGNVEGVRAASLMYFGKEPRHLLLSEAAALVALPQSPETRRPDRHPRAAEEARNRVLGMLATRRIVDAQAAARAARDPGPRLVTSLTQLAPHLALRMRGRSAGPAEDIRTLLDHRLQRQVERIASRAILRWSDAVNIAIIVVKNEDASVVAYLGGVGLSETSRKGFIDLVQAVRSPGSTLKPFVYAMAFEKLVVHPDTIMTDEAFEAGGYRPENADGRFMGDMSARQALIRSRNVPAVMLLQNLGKEAFLARFRSAGRPLFLPTSESAAGLAVALGGVGVTLEQLTWLFSAFAAEGRLHALRYQPSDPVQPLDQFLTPVAAAATADILGDVPSPAGHVRLLAADGGRRVGFKTGTSYGFRDAWAIGFDKLHTVGVWIGRPDGAAHLGAYGVTAAAPILLQVFDHLPQPDRDVGASSTSLGALTGLRDLPDRLMRFPRRGPAGASRPLEITFPRDGADVRVDRGAHGNAELPLAATGGRPPYQWTLNGTPQAASRAPQRTWVLQGHGQLDVSITDADGATARSSFWLQ
jgi:penicillin-binding protein 1C